MRSVVILHDIYLRTVKVRSSSGAVNEYVRVVEAYRDNGKVKQRTVADLGRKDLLAEIFPKLKRLLGHDVDSEAPGDNDLQIVDASTWGPVLAVRALFDQLGLGTILDAELGKAKGVPFADRAFVLIANRLTRPASEHGLAGWLETDFVCDRLGRRFVPNWHRHKRVRVHFRQLEAWYRTLDQLVAAKEKIEVALYHRLRDLFSLKPDLVLYDITSTYFEGVGPANFAKHGHSRDGKPHNVPVIVAVVMVSGWPIAHHVWAGNEVDHTTVAKAIGALHRRFGFNRVVFVGDRGMVTNDNIEAITAAGHGYLVGLKRRRNKKLGRWIAALEESQWIDCPVGITAQEKTNPPRTRAQEVPSGIAGMRVIIVDSDDRRDYEQAMRRKSMERTRQALEKLEQRVAAGKLKQPEKIGAAAERLLQRNHGYRYYSWDIHQGTFRYVENAKGLESEKGFEGKYVIATGESDLSVLEVVAIYKDLSDVERGFRQLKDVLAMRPIYHQIEQRVKAPIFVAALALLVQRLLGRRLEEAGIDFSAERAMEALSTLRLVTLRLEGPGERRGVSGGCPDARRVLKALKLTELDPPTPPADGKTVM
jgi:transposase